MADAPTVMIRGRVRDAVVNKWLLATPEGELWECGVNQGVGAVQLAQLARGRMVRLFDTFAGRPAETEEDGRRCGGWFRDTSVDLVRARLAGVAPDAEVRFHVGLVPQTFAGLEDARVALAVLDMDLYVPTAAALAFVWPRVVPGGALLVHDADEASRRMWPGVWRAVESSGVEGAWDGRWWVAGKRRELDARL